MRRPAPALLYTAIAAMVLFWSANYVVAKLALREFTPALLAGLRTTLAAVIAVPVFLWRRRTAGGTAPRAGRRPGAGTLVWLALTGVVLNQLLFVMGLRRTSVAHASILIALTPIMVLLMAAARGMERLSVGKAAGMGIAVAGVAVLNLSPSRGAHASLAGDLMILINAWCFALFTISGKRVTGCYDGITVTALVYAAGALIMAPLTVWASVGFDYTAVSMGGWAAVVYMAAFPSVVCYLIFYWALMYIPASRVSAFSYYQPVLATVMAAPVLGEKVTVWLGAGGALVLAGVWLAERKR